MKIFNKFLIFTCIWFSTQSIYSQVGIGTTAPDGALDITSTNDGLLIPRIALTITTSALPLTSPIISELVYNSATVADVTPGFYYWNGTFWVRLATGITNDWSTIGNTGIIDGTNFIGTAAATNVDVAFRRNNFAAGKLGTTSTSFGVGALNVGATTNSSAFGTNALTLNTGANNVAVGNGSLAANTTGIENTSVGNNALSLNTGSANSAIGFEALSGNTSAVNNTGIGYQALRNNVLGSNNTAVGYRALNDNRASFNTAVGTQASSLITTGASNTSVGYQAHQNATTGTQNVAIGERSLGRNNGSANTIIGWEAMFGATSSASNSTAVGWHALFNNSGANNTALGYNASQGNTGATENTAIGAGSLNDNITGSRNTAIGRNAGFATTSNDGTFVGYNAGAFSTGTQNAVLGAYALDASGASARNVAIGFNALTNTTSGANNTAIGHSTLNSLVTGSGNVAIGYQAGLGETTSNKLYITNSNTTATTSLIYGEFAPTRILRTNSSFQIGDPAGTGYIFPMARGTLNQILQTNATGVLSWVQDPISTLSVVRTNLNTNQALTNTGWQLVNYNTVVIDTNTEFASNRFTATRAGIYEINAGYHTDNQSNNQFYSIGVYVNGALYQQTSGNHSGLGPVSRNINCVVNLAIGGYVEIFIENYQSPVEIDFFQGKSFFEVKQIK